MKARIFATATVLSAFATSLPAVDPQLLNLMMPDAKVLAGVNVAQAKGSPFGQYVLSQISANDPGLQELASVTGFDPRQDLTEVLVASNGAAGSHNGLAAATGNFNIQMILSAAAAKGGIQETVGSTVILEDPNQAHGVAFLSNTLVVAGDLADVKAAITRANTTTALPKTVVEQATALSNNEDAWGLSTVPLTNLAMMGSNNAPIPMGNLQNSLGSVQSISGGVKFTGTVNVSIQAQTDTAQNATALAGVIQFLTNMAQLNAAKNPQAAAALQSLTATANGTNVSVALSLPEDQFQQLFHPQADMAHPRRPTKK